jgi:hypothetical protein
VPSPYGICSRLLRHAEPLLSNGSVNGDSEIAVRRESLFGHITRTAKIKHVMSEDIFSVWSVLGPHNEGTEGYP